MGSRRPRTLLVACAALTLICGFAFAAPAQTSTTPPERGPIPGVANLGPTREIKLAENTWFRFGAQVQAWFRAAQDRSLTPGATGSYANDFYCRRCRFFATGSVVQNVYFNVLFEAGNYGRGDPTTGVKAFGALNPPQVLDAYGQVKFANWFWFSGGNILLPLTRNGTQPTTTYLSIDNANVDTTPILQGNTAVIRDLGFQANGFFADNHVEYRVGVFQGSRQAGTAAESGSHNGPRFVSSLLLNFWDPETGYVNGGHYFGSKKVIGLMGNFDYQVLRTDASAFPPPGSPAGTYGVGASKDPYYGFSAAAFINYPLSGTPSKTLGDEVVGLLQFGYYDGGFKTTAAGVPTNFGTYPNVLKQTNLLAEAAYYNNAARFSVFGKFEMRKISDDYVAALKATQNQTWIAGGVKYYVAPTNIMNFGLQYEHIQNDDALPGQQGGTNNLTFQMQVLLY